MKNFAKFLATESKYLYDTDIKSVLTWVHDLWVKAEKSKRPRDSRPLLNDPEVGISWRYRYVSPSFFLLDAGRNIISIPADCRDYFNEAIRYHVVGGKLVTSHHVDHRYLGTFDRSTFRMAMFLDSKLHPDTEVDEGIRSGVRIANLYGAVAGWGKLRVSRAKLEREIRDSPGYQIRNAWVVVGDPNWMRYPQFVSLLLLFIRLGLRGFLPEWVRDAYSMQAWWAENLDTVNQGDYHFMNIAYKKLLTLFAHEREIFPGDIDSGYHHSLSSFHSSSGINSLMVDTSTHPKSVDTLNKLYAEVKRDGGS